MKNKAFTLIELLVVISIVALLMAILLPSLGKVKELAKDVVCRSNLKQWGIWWTTYAMQYDDKCPPANNPHGPPRTAWFEAMSPNFSKEGTEGILTCPSANKHKLCPNGQQAAVNGAYWTGWSVANGKLYAGPTAPADARPLYASYGFNLFFGTTPNTTGHFQGRPFKKHFQKFTDVGRRTDITPLMMDSIWRGGSMHYEDGRPGEPHDYCWAPENREFQDRLPPQNDAALIHPDRHSQAINVLCLDGGARKVYLKSLWNLNWNKDHNISIGYQGAWPEWMKDYKEGIK